jgi:hypothetical protein
MACIPTAREQSDLGKLNGNKLSTPYKVTTHIEVDTARFKFLT